MSRSSPCCGTRPCFSTNRWISSKPAMMRSTRGEGPPFLSGSANSSSSERNRSRSMSLITTLIFVTYKGCGTFGHPSFPSILRVERWEPSPFLLKSDGPHGKLLRLLRRQARPLGGNRRCDLFQATFAHRFREDRIGFPERVDTVDQVDVEFTYIHREPPHAVDEGGVGSLLGVALTTADGNLLGLLCQIEGGNRVLAHGLMIFFVKFRVLVLDDLAHADLRQFLGHQLLIEQAALKGSLVLNEGGD